MSVTNVKIGFESVYATITGGEVTILMSGGLTDQVNQVIMKMLNGLDKMNSESGGEDDWVVLFMAHRGIWVAETDGGYSEVEWSDESEQWVC